MRIRRIVIAPAIVLFYSLLLVAGCSTSGDNGNDNKNQNTNQNDNNNDNGTGPDLSLGNLFRSTFDSSDSSAFSQVFEFGGSLRM